MNSVRLSFQGLRELRDALARLPADLAAQAQAITLAAATDAAADIIGAYPERTGNLKNHVVVDRATAGRFGAAARVRSTAKHAHLYERGTAPRQTKQGWNRGQMKRANVFVPAVVRRRRQMWAELVRLVEQAGFTVRGQF